MGNVLVLVVAAALGGLILLYFARKGGAASPPKYVPPPPKPPTELPKQLRPHVRTTWIPEVVKGEAAPGVSKFCGVPFITDEDPWPVCPHCKLPMQLFVQVDLDKAPGDFGEGLLQLFYCVNSDKECEVELEGWEPFSKSHVARIVSPTGLKPVKLPPNCTYPELMISSWIEREDYPGPEDWSDAGVDLPEEESDAYLESCEYPLSGEKLGGWPDWVQGVEYPDCTKCGKKMRLVFQIDSEDNIPWMFGDCGIGHITQCEEHRDVLGFGWACS